MKPLSPRIAILMTLPPLMWAGNAVVGRLMVGQMPPMALNALRWSLAALMLLPLAWPLLRDARERHAVRDAWPYLLLIGTLGIGAFNALQYLALRSSTALNVTLINASMPLWMLTVGAIAFSERPLSRQLIGALLSLAGVATVIARGAWASLADVHFVAGDGFMLVAVIGWAVYSWLLVRPPARLRPPSRETIARWGWGGYLWVQCLFGLVAAGLAAGAEIALADHPPIDWSSLAVWGALLYVAVGPSLIAYRCWGLGVAHAGPALAAFFVNLSPLFAALLSAWLLGEWPQPYHGAAFALIVAGIVVSAWKR
ncbi:MAG TPA: DMT family transporter [Burkholderiaceae bacterium]|jgi:drug/metabolite transporter (DMT)-like permease|nr:DMT family transporter [Burkholderiaceae bacterium]